jgi:hypothetical protein
MGGLAFFDDVDGSWDRMQIGPRVMPGVWEVVSGECARQVDHKKTKGKDGARIKDLGVLPGRFQLKGRMCTEADWDVLQDVIPEINPKKKGGLRNPVTIFHPAVALLGITTIYVERIRPPEVSHGILTITMDVIEWTKSPKPTKTRDKAESEADLAAKRAAQMAANAAVGGGFSNANLTGLNPNIAPSDEAVKAYQRAGGFAPTGAGGFDPVPAP